MNDLTKGTFWYPPTWAIMALSLLLILNSSLCVPLVAGLAIFVAIRWVNNRLLSLKFSKYTIELSAFLCIAATVLLLVAFGWGASSIVDDKSGFSALMIKVTESLVLLRSLVPTDLALSIPANADAALLLAQEWIKSHSAQLPLVGKKVVTLAFHLIIGAFIGAMAAVALLKNNQKKTQQIIPAGGEATPVWLEELQNRAYRFTLAFENVFLAQINIALVNATLTGLFLYFIMPIIGYEIPFVKTLTVLTFFLGLIPILGNLVSNTIIFLVALSVSPMASVLCLGFLIIIHKLEYFLNAWIIGSKIHVKSYELLAAMLFFEAFFGIWGLVLAPVLYAYIKNEIQWETEKSKKQPNKLI